MTTHPGRTIGRGALAGAVAGVVGAAVQYWLVEPSIRAAIAIEEAGAAAAAESGHVHGGEEPLVTRGQQVFFGLLTALVVGVLIGIAFAVAHRYLAHRVSNGAAVWSSMVLAGLGFLTFSLAPALVVPANPPAVGDPATVVARTTTYLASIFLAVVIVSAVVAASRRPGSSPRGRLVNATALGAAGLGVLMFLVPDVSDAIPATVPASLIWNFRIASLAELGFMWLFLGATFGWLSTPREAKTAGFPHAVSTTHA